MPEAQAKLLWTPPSGTLGAIVTEARQRAMQLSVERAQWRSAAESAGTAPSLYEALRQETVGVIAEVKRQSPSKGTIRPEIAAAPQAIAYSDGGAAAISVLTEPRHFGGSDDDLVRVVQAVRIPVLKKDFHVDPVQLYQARALGASAALLIARAVSPQALKELMETARRIRLEVIVEIRTEDELSVALDCGAEIIGVNNRNLETLVIDPTTAERLVPQIPAHCVGIAESGMSTRADVERAAAFGSDAVLVGSAISAADDPRSAVASLSGVSVRRDERSR